MTAAKLPVVNSLDGFVFEGIPINEGLCVLLFLPHRLIIVLIGGTGVGQAHLAAELPVRGVCDGARGCGLGTIDPATRLEE